MSNSYYVFACLLCVLFFFVHRGSAIRCYQCNSHDDPNCENPKEDMIKDCPTNANNAFKLCRKVKQIIEFEVNGLGPDTRVIRTCGWDDSTYKNACYQRSGFGGRQEVCACDDKDGCNAATSVTVTAGLTAASLVMAAIIRMAM